MTWWSRKPRPVPAGVIEARKAETRATEVMREVDSREDEVDLYYVNLSTRKRRNNFGPALMRAMERRGYVSVDS